MIASILKILKILPALVKVIERIYRKRKTEERQADRDALEDNPDLWVSNHFGGVRDDSTRDDADKTDVNNRDK